MINRKNNRMWLGICISSIAIVSSSLAQPAKVTSNQPGTQVAPQWIWSPEHEAGKMPRGSCFFRSTVNIATADQVTIEIAGDDRFTLYLNGKLIATADKNKGFLKYDVSKFVKSGPNVVAVEVVNEEAGPAGLVARTNVVQNGRTTSYLSDTTWRTSTSALPLWNKPFYSDARWPLAKSIGVFETKDTADKATASSQPSVQNQPTGAARNTVANQVTANQSAEESLATPGLRNPLTGDTVATQYQNAVSPNDVTTNRHSTVIVPSGKEWKVNSQQLSSPDFQVPDEFQVQHVAGDADVGSLIAMTFNEFGHMIVSKENGPLLLVYDQNADGTYESVREYCNGIKSCQGLLALSGKVYAIGNGPDGSGLYCLEDADSNGTLEKISTLLHFGGDAGEHGPHGLTLGPDGMLYFITGNHTKLEVALAPSSPYRFYCEGDLVTRLEDPSGHALGIKAPGGTVFRIDLNGQRIESVAGGIRNAYDLAFDGHGRLFIHDSDMEPDMGTTWYRPTRVLQLIPGAEFGWRSGWAKWPEYYHDSLPALADTGRGSPTGMVAYDHFAFPNRYRNTLFSCDWSEGRILVMKTEDEGAATKVTASTFVTGTPLNVCDIDVGPDGWLYFVTGGRGTKGSIYRVTWKGTPVDPQTQLGSGIDSVLRYPQINSAWARQRIAATRLQLGETWASLLVNALQDSQRNGAERARVLDIMALFGPAASSELLLVASRDADVLVRRRATYYLGTATRTLVANRLVELLDDTDGQVRRLACESLVRTQQAVEPNRLAKLLASSDRFESFAARRLLEQQPAEQLVELVTSTSDQRVFIQAATALMMASPSPQNAQAVLQKGQQVMTEFMSDRNFVDLLRTFQLAYHRGGLTSEDTSTTTTLLADEFPASNVVINRELIRLLSYLQVTEIADRYLKQLEVEPLQADRIHLAIHVALMGAQLGGDQKLQLFRYFEPGPNAGSAVADYLQQVSVQLGQTLTEDEITIAIDQGAKYPAAALAAVLQFPETLSDLQKEQLKQLDSDVANSESETAKRLRVAVVALLARDASDASWQYLRSLYETSPDRRVEVTVALAEDPVANWKFVIDGLQFLDNETLRNVLPELRTVNQWPTEAEPFRQVIMTAERLRENGGDDAIRLLEHWKGFASQVEKIPLEKAILAWRRWYAEQFPQSPAPEKFVKAPGGSWSHEVLVNHIVAAQKANAGSPDQGKLVFEKAQCSKCHRMGTVGESMGPDLTGLAKRFRPSEVLESVLEPSKVVSDQYASKTVVTKDGKIYTGILGSGANGEYVILQSDGSKKQLALTEVDEIDSSTVSAMPAGLLNSLTMDEITDLFAYLYSNQIGPVAVRPADATLGF